MSDLDALSNTAARLAVRFAAARKAGEAEICLSMDESGIIPESLPMASVEWELDNGATLRSGLRYPGTGGRAWELVDDDTGTRCDQ
jgi:hypothetical protein